MISKRTILKAPPEAISSWGWGGVGWGSTWGQWVMNFCSQMGILADSQAS